METTTDRRPTYVRELDLERRRAQAALAGLEEGLAWLQTYLNSSKFQQSVDRGLEARMVSVDDVLARLADATSLSLDYEADVR